MASENVCRNCLRDVIERRDRKGKTPLHYAVESNEINFIRFLIDAGADVNAKDNKGNTPINDFRVYYSEKEEYDDRHETLSFLIASGADVNNKGEYGQTILHDAVEQSSHGFINSLLEQGANINVVDDDGDTPLHIAVKHKHEIVVELLLEHHPDITRNNEGKTPLDIAEEYDPEYIAQMLREYIETLPEIKEPDLY